jgi:hypothetical protein
VPGIKPDREPVGAISTIPVSNYCMHHRSQEEHFVDAIQLKAGLMSAGTMLMMSAVAAGACSCSAPPVQEVFSRADVVFRGTIVALRPSTKTIEFPGVRDTGKIAVFNVSRIWKGDIGATFEMPAHEELAACWGFWPKYLEVGNDLLVYVFRVPGETESGGTYMFETSICARTAPARANEDLGTLGAGYESGGSPEARQRRAWYTSAVVIVGTGALVLWVIQRRRASHAGDFIRLDIPGSLDCR